MYLDSLKELYDIAILQDKCENMLKTNPAFLTEEKREIIELFLSELKGKNDFD